MIFLLLAPFFPPTPALAVPDPCSYAVIENYHPPVSLHREENGQDQSMDVAAKNLMVKEGVHVVTEADGWADLRLCDGSALRVGEKSDFQLEQALSRDSYWAWIFQLAHGSLLSVIEPGKTDHLKLSVRTKQAALGVRGTQFVVDAGDDATSLHTLEGEVLLGPVAHWGEFLKGSIPTAPAIVAVPTGHWSRLSLVDSRPAPAAPFDVKSFHKERGTLLQSPPERKAKAEAAATSGPAPVGSPAFQESSVSPVIEPSFTSVPSPPKSAASASKAKAIPAKAAAPSAAPKAKESH